MQVGDLVALSSSGSKLSTNWAHQGDIGVIVQVKHNAHNPYQIRWVTNRMGRTDLYWFKRYEIKKAKPIS